MKKTIIIFLLLACLFSLSAEAIAEKNNSGGENKNYVASTSWVASIAYLAGLDNVKTISPANLRHPPEYEITVNDLLTVKNADLFMNAGYEKMMNTITSSAELPESKILKIKTTNTLSNLTNMVNIISLREKTIDKSTERFNKIENLFFSARSLIHEYGLDRLSVYANTNQAEFAADLGLNVRYKFGTGPLTSEQIEYISKNEPDLIIDNSHAPVASPALQVSSALLLVWSNFPDNTEPDALYKVLLDNINSLLEAYGIPQLDP